MAVVRRILTASFWVPATYYLLSSDVTGFFYLTAVVAISLQEYYYVIAPGLNINLGSEECKGENKIILVALGVALSVVAHLGSAKAFNAFAVLAMLGVVLYHFGLRWIPRPYPPDAVDFATFFVDLFGMTIAWGFSHLILLRAEPQFGRAFTAIAVGASWSSDTGALVFGKLFGRYTPPLMPSVSPKKTWAGLAGAIIGSLLVMYSVVWLAERGMFFPLPYFGANLDVTFLGILFGLTSVFGDALESVMKRAGEVKDSGVFFPGHGGFLDKIDSITVTSIVLYHFILPFLSTEATPALLASSTGEGCDGSSSRNMIFQGNTQCSGQ